MTATSQRHALVLGGTGFLGRHIVSALLGHGYQVTVVARRPVAVSGVELVTMTIDERAHSTMSDLLTTCAPDVVINATGSIWGKSEQSMRDVVAVPTLTVLATLATLNHPPRYIQLGSVLELGKIPVGTKVNASTPSTEPCAYGATKLLLTRKALDQFHYGGLTGLVLRIANICGPGAPDISLLGRVAHVVAGDGPQPRTLELDPLIARRDYVDVRDVARAVVLASATSASGELVDIGRGEAVPVRSLVDLMIELSGRDVTVIERPGSRAPSSEDWTCINPEPAYHLLGWRPRITLRESMADHLGDVRTRALAVAS